MLLQGDLVAYLLESGLIGAERIVAGDLVVQDVSRRNRNFKVLQEKGPSYFLKQAVAPDAQATVGREAAILGYLTSVPSARRLARHLPTLSHYDPQQHVLIQNLSPNAETLDERFARTRRVPTRTASALGTILGTLHRVTADGAARAHCEREWRGRTPWVFRIHRPDVPLLWTASEANLSLIRIIQEFPGLGARLDDLDREWRVECLIHGDLKSANLVVGEESGGKGALKLIDWELAGMGDPAWDVGSVWSDALCLWLLSIPMAQDTMIEKSLELAPFPLKRLVPALRSFWQAYVDERGFDPSHAEAFLTRSVSHAAARLLQTAFEGMLQTRLVTTNVVCLTQLSWNMMRRPHSAASDLLGLISLGGDLL